MNDRLPDKRRRRFPASYFSDSSRVVRLSMKDQRRLMSSRRMAAGMASRHTTPPPIHCKARQSHLRPMVIHTADDGKVRPGGSPVKSSAPMFMAMTIFILSEAEERKRMGTLDTCRIWLHQW